METSQLPERDSDAGSEIRIESRGGGDEADMCGCSETENPWLKLGFWEGIDEEDDAEPWCWEGKMDMKFRREKLGDFVVARVRGVLGNFVVLTIN